LRLFSLDLTVLDSTLHVSDNEVEKETAIIFEYLPDKTTAAQNHVKISHRLRRGSFFH